jgi:choice-of-anchor B domain-containing protein
MKSTLLSFALLFSSVFTFAQKNIQQLGHLTYPNGVQCSNLTSYVDTAGREYALVGNTQGLSIVDITNPTNPTQLFLVPGATGQGAFWREVREYNGFAYVTTEQASGIVVVNLNYLPDSIGFHTIKPDGMSTSHTIFIDENGVAYVNGTDKGLLYLDLKANAWNPPLLGKFTNYYVHDCIVRNDTMWAACIDDGFMHVVDVSNKATTNNPSKVIAQWNTPQDFAHNAWLSDDNKYIFTTDEKPNSVLACYDISDLSNVTELSRGQSAPGTNTIIHNTYFLNNYAVNSYYTYGVSIFDVTRKNNLVEVGNFDTSPGFSGDGFNGAWGVWCYLPSGNIIASDIETGLWVLKPTYKRACYLEGTVVDTLCGTLLNNVTIQIVGANVTTKSNFAGKYATGTVDSGTYTIRFSKPGYQTKEINAVQLKNGILTTFNIQLVPISTSNVYVRTIDSLTGAPIPFLKVIGRDSLDNTIFDFSTDANGGYSFCDFVQGKYDFYAGRWGKVTAKLNKTINTSVDTITIAVQNGYYDDFIMNYGWTSSTSATKGAWVKGKPVGTNFNGTPSNPGADHPNDFGKECYTTGNGGGQAGEDDIDDGTTILRSPLFSLNTYNDPYLSYYKWFYNDGGSGSAPNDSLIVTLTTGFDTVIIDVSDASSTMSSWQFKKIRIKDYAALTANMRIEFKAIDNNPGHIVEAAIDVFMVTDSASADTTTGINNLIEKIQLSASPNPFKDELNISVELANGESGELTVTNVLGELVFQSTRISGRQLLNIREQWTSGVYFLQMKTNYQRSASLKLIKTH